MCLFFRDRLLLTQENNHFGVCPEIFNFGDTLPKVRISRSDQSLTVSFVFGRENCMPQIKVSVFNA